MADSQASMPNGTSTDPVSLTDRQVELIEKTWAKVDLESAGELLFVK